MKRLVLLVFLVLVAGQAQAESLKTGPSLMTGYRILNLCNASQGDADRTHCYGYIQGASDVAGVMSSQWGLKLFCPQVGVNTGQLRLVVKNYLEEHPERLHFGAGSLVLDAFRQAFPCK